MCMSALIWKSSWNNYRTFVESALEKKYFFLILNQSICCGYPKEPSQWDGSFEHPKHMLKFMGKTIFKILRWNLMFILTCELPSFPEQSMRFFSESETSFPVFLKFCPSRAPVAENDQHDPHCPCKIGGDN